MLKKHGAYQIYLFANSSSEYRSKKVNINVNDSYSLYLAITSNFMVFVFLSGCG